MFLIIEEHFEGHKGERETRGDAGGFWAVARLFESQVVGVAAMMPLGR